ncbi:protoporphyrinogen oxidase [Thermocrinis sp.]
MTDVAVVGSGISGLSVAYRLKRAGADVKVFEKEDKVGGNIQTKIVDGYVCELGPQTILADKKVEEFLSLANIKPIYAKEEAKIRYIYKKRKLIPLPLSPVSFLTSPLFSLWGKLRVLKEPFVPKSIKSEETIAEFVKRRLGEEFLDYVVDPFVSGVYAGDVKQLSVKYAVKRVYELEQRFGSLIKGAIKLKALGPAGKLIAFEGGNHSLPSELARSLEVDLENVVLKIRRKDDKFVLETRKGKVEAKAVVVSAPATSAGYLLRDLSWSVAQEFDQIYYAPVVVVHVATRDPIPPGFGFLVPRKEGKRILGVLFSSNIFPDRKGNLLTIYLGGATDPQVVEEEDEIILGIVEEELKEILGINATLLNITKWKKGIPQYNVGYGRYYELVEMLEKENPGLFLTGNYLNGVSVADCIRNSEMVSKRVLEFLQR